MGIYYKVAVLEEELCWLLSSSFPVLQQNDMKSLLRRQQITLVSAHVQGGMVWHYLSYLY